MATLSAIHFASMILARSTYYIHYQSQTGAWFWDLCNQLPKGAHGISSHIPPLGTQIFIYASCTCICGIWGTTTMIRPSTLLVGIRWEYKDIYSFGDANAYDLYKPIWILPKIQAGFEGGRGRLFVATAGVD